MCFFCLWTSAPKAKAQPHGGREETPPNKKFNSHLHLRLDLPLPEPDTDKEGGQIRRVRVYLYL